MLGWGSPFHSPFPGPQHQGKAPASPLQHCCSCSCCCCSCKTGIGWDYLREKKRRRRDQSSRQREGDRVHFPPTALGLPPSLSPLQQHQEPQTEPRAAFSISSVPFPPSVSHTARREPLPPLDFPSHAQPLVSFKALEIPLLAPAPPCRLGLQWELCRLLDFPSFSFSSTLETRWRIKPVKVRENLPCSKVCCLMCGLGSRISSLELGFKCRLEKAAAVTTNSGGDFKCRLQIFSPTALDWGWVCKLFNELRFLDFSFFGLDSLSQGRGCRDRKLGWANKSASITGKMWLFGEAWGALLVLCL